MGILSGKEAIDYSEFARLVQNACGYDHTAKFLSAIKSKFGSGRIKIYDLKKYIKEDLPSKRNALGILSEDLSRISGKL